MLIRYCADTSWHFYSFTQDKLGWAGSAKKCKICPFSILVAPSACEQSRIDWHANKINGAISTWHLLYLVHLSFGFTHFSKQTAICTALACALIGWKKFRVLLEVWPQFRPLSTNHVFGAGTHLAAEKLKWIACRLMNGIDIGVSHSYCGIITTKADNLLCRRPIKQIAFRPSANV